MKKLSLLAILPLLSLVEPAAAETSLTVLEKRCSEQERQIRQLEEENSRLRSLVKTATSMEAPGKSATADPDIKAPAPSPAPKPVFYTVVQGDTLSRIARKNGTTPETLAKLNKLKDVGMIRPGQKLELPLKQPATISQTIADPPAAKNVTVAVPDSSDPAGTHTVKDGETFFGIARKYGISVDALAEANPKVNPRSIRIGQNLLLVPREVEQPVAKTETTPDPTQSSSADPSTTPVINQPLIRSIRIDKEINFGDFAKAHGMDPAKLNALNGLHLESNTVLAKGSELYVSAQP